MTGAATDAGEIRQPENSGREQHDVLARDSQQVVEPRAPERLLHAVREPRRVAEQHALDERQPLTGETWSRRAPKPPAKPVRDAADPAAPADDPPAVDLQHHVHALATQPRAFVEAVVRPSRRRDDGQQRENSSLRRGATERKLELDALIEARAVEPRHTRELTCHERPRPGFGRGHRSQIAGRPDPPEQKRPVECVETETAPPPARDEQHEGDEPEAASRKRACDGNGRSAACDQGPLGEPHQIR